MSLRLSSVRRSTSRAQQHARARRSRRLWVPEGLEDRVLLSGNPTYYTVNLTSDTGAPSGTDATTGTPSGDLLWAVTQANANTNTAGSVIEFDPTVFAASQTITLASTLALSESAGPEVIEGPSAGVVINGDGTVGVFQVGGDVTATFAGLTISGGSATYGGGIDNSGTLTVTDSTITNNYAGNGGGGIENTGMLTLTNSTVAFSSTNGRNGGGIDNLGTLTAVNATIAYNTGGGGLYDEAGSTTTLDNTIVALNLNAYSYGYAGPRDITGGSVSAASAYNLIGSGGSGGLTSGINGNLVGVADPRLAMELANNGGLTQTIALLPGSPAIDRGSNALADEYSLTTDQRGAGFPRVVNGTVDIGAFESPVFGNPTVYTVNLTSDTGAFNGTNAATAASGDLLWAITQSNANTNPAGSVITFAPAVFNASSPQTITLTSTLELSEAPWPEVLQGSGANAVTISGNNAVQVVEVGSATTATISGLTISGGFATDNPGGGIGNRGMVTVTDCTIESNTVSGVLVGGGGIYNSGTLTVTDSTIEDNSSPRDGGGVFNSSAWPAMLSDCTINGNSAGRGGGVASYGYLTASNCTVAGNSAVVGGGVYLDGGTMILTNSTITENSASAGGGGAFARGSGASYSATSLRVINSTVADNSGGGIYVAGSAVTLTIDNSIVALNTSGGAADVGLNSPSVAVVAYNNLVGVDGTGTLTNGVNGNIVGVNPHLGPLANNGGPTETMALLPGSPAIGAGSVALAVDANGNPLTTDQRGPGYPRVVNRTVDIGAYEAGTASVYTVDLTSDSGTGSGNAGDLSYCIAQANANQNPSGSVIEFDPTVFNASQTITLSSTLVLGESAGPEVIDGSSAGVVISGNNTVGVFQVSGGTTATLSGLTISGGSAPADDPFGSAIDNSGTLAVTGCTIEDNTGEGTIFNQGGLTVSDSTIEDNSGGDGGVYNTSNWPVMLTDCTIKGNSGYGVLSVGYLTADNCTIADNSRGIRLFGGSLTLTNSTVTGNSSIGVEDKGTGGSGSLSSGTLTVTNCTIADNSGGGIYVLLGALTLENSIVALNTSSGAADLQASQSATLVANNNLVGVDGTGTLTNGVNGNIVGVNPLLGPLANNGGPTETMALLPGSPAIGAGSVALAVDANGNPLTTDQRGEPRIVNNNVDIGAFEGQEENTTTTVTASPVPSVSGQSVTFTATVVTQAGSAIPIPTGSIQFEVDGSNFGGPVALVNGSATSTAINSLSVTSHTISAVYTSNSADFIGSTGSGSITVEDATVSNIQSVINNALSSSGGSVTLLTTSSTAVSTAVQAINGANPSSPVTVTLDLDGGTYTTDTELNAPAGVTVVIEDGTLVGGSPALVVDSGTVILNNVTATNATNAPTILVNGGSLFVRNSTIEESTGYSEAGILITGGSVNLGTATSPGDNVLNINGTGEFVENATSSSVPDIGNTLDVNGTPLLSPYLSFTSLASSSASSVYGQSVTLTAAVRAASSSDGTPSGEVNFLNTTTGANLGSAPVTNGVATLITSALAVGSHTITADYAGNSTLAFSLSTLTQTVQQDSTTTSVSVSATTASFGEAVTFTAKVAANAPGTGTPTGTVDFFDTTTGDDLSSVALSGGQASLSTASLPPGGNTIKVTYSGDGNFLTSSASTGTITVGQSIIVLDLSAGGALSLSGNASIKLSGGVFVDSSSSSALSASGNAEIKATVIDVHGGAQKSGNASFSPAPTTGALALADPLASLAEPSTSGLTNYGSESLSGNSSATIKPGMYSAISASGNASLTLCSGLYIIEGGGFSISGNASVSGSGVTIVSAGSKYPSSGGTYGSITLSGNGSYNLSPPTTGTYAGIVIFQSRDNTKALTISGNASGMSGTIYAPAAQLAESGNAQLNASIDVDTLSISGNGVSNTVTLSSPSGTVAYTPAQIRTAYGINALALDGTGQIIAIVDAYDDPEIDQALDAFDTQFGLTSTGPTLYAQYGPATSFLTVLNQYGQATSFPSTDPNGPGTNNWEVEESLDVEWAHAIAPGAQIVLVEANSQSLSDLMAAAATAASQPDVSVVSMSWGFAEGQAVFASDEATYDSVFTTPGVTFVASTGDYGAADPEYPAFSPNVVAVGGTSLTLNSDNSYNTETGWGYYSIAAGSFIGSGGGISLYEPEPAYQQGVQSTGMRTTPDVSLVADPATGAWIADSYNLDPSNPFEIVGGTSLSAPAWAGLSALVNQGRAAASEPSLNSSSPTDAQQALYMLPQSDYNVIASGSNGYTAGAGYNLVTGLGTPVANLLVPDLVAYCGTGTTYSGPTVARLQNANLFNAGATSGGPIDVFRVFDAVPMAGGGLERSRSLAPGRARYAAGSTTLETSTAAAQFSHAAMSIGGTTPDADVPRTRAKTLANRSPVVPSAAGLTSATIAIDQVLGALPAEGAESSLIEDVAVELLAIRGHRRSHGAFAAGG